MKKFNYMLEIDILRNSSQNFWGVLRVWVSERHPDAQLAKTIFLTQFCLVCLCH